MTALLPNIFAIEMPEGTAGISFRQSEFVNSTVSFYDQFTNKETLVELPGNCTHLFTTKGVSEEDAKKVVGKEGVHPSWPFNPLYTNYGKDRVYIDDPRESLKSLLRSKGLTAGNYLIIKKVAD